MNMITVRQGAALRLMLSIEKTTRTAEILREGREMESRDVDVAVRIGALNDKYAKATVALEEATIGKTNPDEQIRIPLPDELVEQLHSVVVAGAYTVVNPEAADEEGAALIASLRDARKPLLAALARGQTFGFFPVQVHGGVVLH